MLAMQLVPSDQPFLIRGNITAHIEALHFGGYLVVILMLMLKLGSSFGPDISISAYIRPAATEYPHQPYRWPSRDLLNLSGSRPRIFLDVQDSFNKILSHDVTSFLTLELTSDTCYIQDTLSAKQLYSNIKKLRGDFKKAESK